VLRARQVVLSSGERMDYGVCVWSTGNSSRPLVQARAAPPTLP